MISCLDEPICLYFLKIWKAYMQVWLSHMTYIYISPPNYHPFSGWHPELPTLVLRPPKLPTSHFLAPSVSLSRQIGWKEVTCRARDIFSPKSPNMPLCTSQMVLMV
jgi:hypothetical protein